MSDTATMERAVDDGERMETRGKHGFNVPGNVVTVGTANYPDEQRDALRWLYAYAQAQGLTQEKCAQEIKYSGAVLSRAWRGEYEGSIEEVVRRIQSFKKLVDERAQLQHVGFVETSISDKIFKLCEWALASNSVNFIFGDPQIGKTEALERWALLHNHGQTKMFRMPAAGGVQLMMKTIAAKCGVSQRQPYDKLRRQILEAIDRNTLLICDEVHEVFLTRSAEMRVRIIEQLREIYDLTHCGMVVCGTNVLREEIQNGRQKEMLEQFGRRGVAKLQLPARPPKRDLDRFAKAFGLEAPDGEAAELVQEVVTRSGLGGYIKFLQAAGRYAKKKGRVFGWDDFITAHDIMARLSTKED